MFDALLAALRNTGIEFAENGWVDARKIGGNADYGVISIDGSGRTVWADGHMEHQAIEGTVDLFCHGSGRDRMATVQNVFDMLGVSYTLQGVDYENTTRLTHWSWVFQLEEM